MRIIIYSVCIILFLFPLRTGAFYEPVCTLSLKNNLWKQAPFKLDIIKLQKFLLQKGYAIPVVGIYGPQTERSVREFQKSLDMYQSGEVGYITRIAINSEICNIPLDNFDPKIAPVTDITVYEKKVILPIPLIEQKYRLTCEAASVQMALLYKNISLNQDQIMWHIGWAKPYKSFTNSFGMVWGDPDIGFVGNEKGHVYVYPKGILGATGWGVNEGPVATMLKKFLSNSFSKKDASVQDIIQALDNQNPVIFWFKEDTMQPQTESYTTPLGKTVTFTTNHVALIVGYRTNNGITEYLLNDPAYGRRSMSEIDLIRYWNRMENRMVVVQ